MNPFLNKPFDRSFTVVPGTLWGGNYPGDRDIKVMKQRLLGLVSCGIQVVVNLMAEGEADPNGESVVPYEDLFRRLARENGLKQKDMPLCVRMPIPDGGVVSTEVMNTYLGRINWAVRYVPTYIHCQDGIGRTSTVIGCLLASWGMVTGQDALVLLDRIRKLSGDPKANEPASQTEQQRDMVKVWPSILEVYRREFSPEMFRELKCAQFRFDWEETMALLRGIVEGEP